MKILFFLLFSLSFTSVFAVGETSPELGSYEGYKENVKIFCKPTDSNLWVDRKDDNLIKIEEVPYSDISKREAGDAKYTAYLTSIKADSSKINFLSLGIGPQFLNKASFVYKETMSSIYSCAVMNAKVRIINNLLSNKKLQSTQSNMSTKLKGQLTRMRMDMSKKGCLSITNTASLSLKKILLDNTTYQYCVYRQYLYYLDIASKKSLSTYYKNGSGVVTQVNPLANTDSAAREIALAENKITREIAHTKEVYPQAMVAFSEFEKTYAAHIILTFIHEDYVTLRTSLKQLLNPIGQVIYKISNAQSPK